MKKKLVIIGAGAEQAYAYKLAHDYGYFVIATDANPKAPSVILSDHFLLASTRDANETLNAIISYCKHNGKIDGVMTIANDVPHTVACVADYFNLPGHSVSSAILANNKFLMKEAFKKNNIPCPDFWKVSSLAELKDLVSNENLIRFVIKPVDGCGARGVLLLKHSDDLKWAFDESLSWSNEIFLIVERFIPGMQISSESYLVKGKAYTPALAERNYSRLEEFSPYIVEDGGTIPAPIDDNGEPQIIELALRLSGGWFASNQIITATGVDLVDAVIKQALGMSVTQEMLSPKCNKSTSIRYWFPKAGEIKSIKGEDKIKKYPGFIKYGFFRKVGDKQPVVKTHPDRFGYAMAEGRDRVESISRVNKMLDMLNIEIKKEGEI